MRDYRYIWHDPDQRFLVGSGFELKSFLPSVAPQGGIVFIDREAESGILDPRTGFSLVSVSGFQALAREDLYSWGSFAWADCKTATLPAIPDDDIAELLFFARLGRPLHRVVLSSLRNRFLFTAHDDGWYLRLYYSNWEDVVRILDAAVPASVGTLDLAELRRGDKAFWLRGGEAQLEEKTDDIDRILGQRKWHRRSRRKSREQHR